MPIANDIRTDKVEVEKVAGTTNTVNATRSATASTSEREETTSAVTATENQRQPMLIKFQFQISLKTRVPIDPEALDTC